MKQYSIDPAMIGLEEFRKLTAGRRMLPGRVALQEDMEERFGVLKESKALFHIFLKRHTTR